MDELVKGGQGRDANSVIFSSTVVGVALLLTGLILVCCLAGCDEGPRRKDLPNILYDRPEPEGGYPRLLPPPADVVEIEDRGPETESNLAGTSTPAVRLNSPAPDRLSKTQELAFRKLMPK